MMMTTGPQQVTEFEQRWVRIENGMVKMKKIVEGSEPLFTKKENMMIYSDIYNLCIEKDSDTEKIYDKLKAEIKEHLTGTVLPSIREKHDEFFLRELVERWKDHQRMLSWITRVFNYLDRYFTHMRNLPSLSEVGATSFQEQVYHELHSTVKAIVLSHIARDRKREQIDGDLLKNIHDILNNQDSEENNYAEDFEADVVKETAAYYSRKASKWMMKYSCPEYMLKVDECLKKERERFLHYLHGISEEKLMKTVETELLVVHADHLLKMEQSGCLALLNDGKVDDLSRIFRLYHDKIEGVKIVSSIFKERITDEGLAIINQAIEDANGQADNGCGVDEQVLIRKIIELNERYNVYVGMMNHSLFHKSVKDAFEVFCNKTVAGISSPELLATFFDNILKKGGRETLGEEAIEDILEKAVKVLAHISGKDIFAEFYREKLARRLLLNKGANDQNETNALTKIRQLCGGTFTSKMDGMVMDLTLAKENRGKFKEYLRKHPTAKPGVGFSVAVLTTGYWPAFPSSGINLPEEMVRCVEVFQEYYGSTSKKRRVRWIYSLGSCNVVGNFDSQPIELIITTLQAVVLLLFNNSGSLSYSDIKAQSNMDDDDLDRVLFTLSSAKYRILNKSPRTRTISPTDSFEFNSNFTDKLKRIKIPLPTSAEKAKNKIVEDACTERKYAVDAAIVRVMKCRKVLSHQLLITECVDYLQRIFKPDIKLIKKRIDDLIERDFIAREGGDSDKYRYVA